MTPLRLTWALALLTLPACDGFLLGQANTELGHPVVLGDGTAQSWFETDRQGQPITLGVRLSSSLDTLSDDDRALALPRNGTVLPFDHVALDWNPEGTAPTSAFGGPHLDVVFFLLTQEERSEIEPGDCQESEVSCEALQRGLMPLPSAARVPGYVSLQLVLPEQGDHLIDVTAPEFIQGVRLRSAWIYGRFDGLYAFFKPRFARSYLETLEGEECHDIPLPEAYTQAGWFPTRYCASWDPVEGYEFTLRDFERFTTAFAL